MKRILTFFMVCMIVCAMVVPASAQQIDINFSGNIITTPDFNVDDHPYVCVWYEDITAQFVVRAFDRRPSYDGSHLRFDRTPVKMQYANYFMSADKWTVVTDSEVNTDAIWVAPIWTTFDLLNTDGSVFLSSRVCDGSSCPATDANSDSRCDDCGKMLWLFGNEFPTLPVVPGAYKHHVLVQSSSGRYDYSVFVSDTAFTAKGVTTAIHQAQFNKEVSVYRFSSSNGGEWVKDVDGLVTESFTVGATGYFDFLDSSFNWYDVNGDLFFPDPLWMVMDRVTQGEMVSLMADLTGTMRILTACGVGCLALLIFLVLFGKRWLLSLR